MKKIIINADDFGLTKGINKAIIKCYKKGIVTSASIMANGREFKDAVELFQENDNLDLGIHLSLIGEVPILTGEEIPSLIGRKGFFLENYFMFFKKYIAGKIDKNQIELELRAQIEKCLNVNLKLSHINSHQHLHIVPGILDIVLRLARYYVIPVIRYPYGYITFRDFASVRIFPQLVLNALSLISKARFEKERIMRTRYLAGFIHSGRLNREVLDNYIALLPDGITEICCHPGIVDDDLKRHYGHWKYHWEQEWDLFSSDETRNLLHQNKIQVISFKNLL
jgi:hopanoid biosynthesis associated protein HpnK